MVNFDYSVLFKEKIESKNTEKLMEAFCEYRQATNHNMEEFINVISVLKTSTYANMFANKKDILLEIFNNIKQRELALDALDALANLIGENDCDISSLMYEEFKKRFSDSIKLDKCMQLSGILRGESLNVIGKAKILMHLEKGAFVYHRNGWGVGKIIDFSFILENVSIEFEGTDSIRLVDIKKLYPTILPIRSDHFLVDRFVRPRELEFIAKHDPVSMMKKMLKDLGGLTTKEIQETLVDIVVPKAKWESWWNKVKELMKKDEECILNNNRWSIAKDFDCNIDQVILGIKNLDGIDQMIEVYDIMKRITNINKNKDFNAFVIDCFETHLDSSVVEDRIVAAIVGYSINIFDKNSIIKNLENVHDSRSVINKLKKQPLKKIYIDFLKYIPNWKDEAKKILLFSGAKQQRVDLEKLTRSDDEWMIEYNSIIDKLENFSCELPLEFRFWYVNKKLNQELKEDLTVWLSNLLKVIVESDKSDENKETYKKAIELLRRNRYSIFRNACSVGSKSDIRDAIFIAERCNELQNNDVKVLKSVASVIFPDIFEENNKKDNKNDIVWSTAQGIEKAKQELHDILTRQMSENTSDVKKARAYGDLRENFEYKSALEKRKELQLRSKTLMNLLQKAKVIDRVNLDTSEVNIGCCVILQNTKNNQKIQYIILGPWDADAELGVISFNAAIACNLIGKKIGDIIEIDNHIFKLVDIKAYEN